MIRKLREGKLAEKDKDNQENESCVIIQQRMRGILARKQVELLRTEEMQFLGMQKKKKTAEEERNDPIKILERNRMERKSVQEGNWKNYLNAKAVLKDEIEENQGTDIMEGMLKERRDWITEWRENHMNKIPDEIKPFYDRFNVEAPLSPEEEEAKRLAEEEEKGKKKKKGEKKKEKKKKKKGKKSDGDDGPAIIKIGPSEVIQKFDE